MWLRTLLGGGKAEPGTRSYREHKRRGFASVSRRPQLRLAAEPLENLVTDLLGAVLQRGQPRG
jgi:hypothetical protein